MTNTSSPKLTKGAVAALQTMINARLAAPGGTREARLELAMFLEAALHGARAYRGFRYLEVNEAGVREYNAFMDRERERGGFTGDAYEAEYKLRYEAAFGDDSRRCYY